MFSHRLFVPFLVRPKTTQQHVCSVMARHQKSILTRRPATTAVSIGFLLALIMGALFLAESMICKSGVKCSHGVMATL